MMTLTPMLRNDIDEAASLVGRAMNASEEAWARKTMQFHFSCQEHGMNDGREYYLWKEAGEPMGIVGLHQYEWGPPENVWLAWFALDPRLQGKGHGIQLMDSIVQTAKERGYKKLFIETYDHDDFARAVRFYKRYGFASCGEIKNYLPDGSAMLVLSMEFEVSPC